MRYFLRILIAGILLCFVSLGYIFWKHPYLSPLFRRAHPAEDYFALKASTVRPQNDMEMIRMFEAYYPYWLGTKWDFNGTTETPGKGSIACGYFVTTLLRDMHIDLQRITLAQAASEVMIMELVDDTHIHRYALDQNAEMFQNIRAGGENLYIIGLDNHTGFIYYDGREIKFIHSSGAFPYRVVEVDAERAKTILTSNYKVLGCISQSASLR